MTKSSSPARRVPHPHARETIYPSIWQREQDDDALGDNGGDAGRPCPNPHSPPALLSICQNASFTTR